ncbi:hypothetical protein HK100_012599 [Physocladia obscura]|uniref:Uncharacterized protein n=1 Tax=Physocladia obscura TaxID=109957 RepID=A0AAD5XG52_9FUNG|nr:hypothetical protein HK100_012599 [Physocladia obscura]
MEVIRRTLDYEIFSQTPNHGAMDDLESTSVKQRRTTLGMEGIQCVFSFEDISLKFCVFDYDPDNMRSGIHFHASNDGYSCGGFSIKLPDGTVIGFNRSYHAIISCETASYNNTLDKFLYYCFGCEFLKSNLHGNPKALDRDKQYQKRLQELTAEYDLDSEQVKKRKAENHPTSGNLVVSLARREKFESFITATAQECRRADLEWVSKAGTNQFKDVTETALEVKTVQEFEVILMLSYAAYIGEIHWFY